MQLGIDYNVYQLYFFWWNLRAYTPLE